MVRCQGLAKLMAESNLDANQINMVIEDLKSDLCDMDHCEWYTNVIYYLQQMEAPPHLTENEKRSTKLLAIRYIILQGSLWWRNFEGVLLKCIDQEKAKEFLNKMHAGVCGGHYMAKTTTHKVMRSGFWWPSLFKDAQIMIRKCDPCQRFAGKLKFSGNTPLNLVKVQAPFQQWGMDFIGEISPKYSTSYSLILVAIDYFTKWVEAIPTRNATSKVVNNFLLNNIISRFGFPQKIVIDNAMCFKYDEFIKFCDKFRITRSSSLPYHPQGNGQAESTNKSLLKVIKRTLDDNNKAWDSKLQLSNMG